MVPKVVLMRSGLVTLTTARPVNTTQLRTTVNSARPMKNVFNKAHLTVRRPIHKNTTIKNSNFNQRVNTVKDKKFNTARPKVVVNAARPKAVVNVVKGNNINAVKASACWVWKPMTKVLDHVSKHNIASIALKRFDYVDAQGRSKNKKDERGIVIKNKARLVTQGYTQEEGINYDEGKIKEEVYVCQPPGFEDLDFPDRVYKVEKALYGLHQAPRAWYETLSTYLLNNGFQRGKIDKTLFIRRDKGELTFFLGLQVKQKEDGIFISQDKYVTEILKKFGFTDVKTASTPMETQKLLLKDEDGEEMDVYLYRSMIGSLMYLTSSRPDI
ncbi:retrovirus-related pol polyprotein from transposon TNT 1-94, partial [Tanacetum coccineum]